MKKIIYSGLAALLVGCGTVQTKPVWPDDVQPTEVKREQDKKGKEGALQDEARYNIVKDLLGGKLAALNDEERYDELYSGAEKVIKAGRKSIRDYLVRHDKVKKKDIENSVDNILAQMHLFKTVYFYAKSCDPQKKDEMLREGRLEAEEAALLNKDVSRASIYDGYKTMSEEKIKDAYCQPRQE